MIRKIFKTGHSLAITISKKILDDLGLKIGDAVSVEADKDKETIVIRHGKRQQQLAMALRTRPRLGSKP